MCVKRMHSDDFRFCQFSTILLRILFRRSVMANATLAVQPNDKREIFGWAMYDWANSAFSTTVGTVFLGPYVASLATHAAKAEFLIRNGVEWNDKLHAPLVASFFGIPAAPDPSRA